MENVEVKNINTEGEVEEVSPQVSVPQPQVKILEDKVELTEKEKEIFNYVNDKIEDLITDLKMDVKEKGFNIEIKFNIGFVPIGEGEVSVQI